MPREAALVAGISSMAKNVMKGNMKEVLGSHKQLVAFAKSGNISSGVSDAQGDTSRVFGIVKKNAPLFTDNDEFFVNQQQ